MAMLDATVFDLQDRIAAAITAQILAGRIGAAEVATRAAFSASQGELVGDGVAIRVIPSAADPRRVDRNVTATEDTNEILIQILRNCPTDEPANTRPVGNFAVALMKYFRENSVNATSGDVLVDSESEIETLFDDQAFALAQMAMAVIRLTYRRQSANT